MLSKIKLVFIIGTSKSNNKTTLKMMENKLKMEFNLYNDIVQGDFVDEYRNLTLKCLYALKWISIYCNSSSWPIDFIVKTDDDVVLNTNFVSEYLIKNGKNLMNEKKIVCNGYSNSLIQRNKKSKWYVKPSELNGTVRIYIQNFLILKLYINVLV